MRFTTFISLWFLALITVVMTACGGASGGGGAAASGSGTPVSTCDPATQPILMTFGDSHASGGFTDTQEPGGRPILFTQLLAGVTQLCLMTEAHPGSKLPAQLNEIHTYGSIHTKFKLLMVGYNDSNTRDITQPTLDAFGAELAEALPILSASSDEVFIGTPPKTMLWLAVMPASITEAYADVVRNTVAASGLANVHLVEITDHFNYGANEVVSDTAHFNRAGATWLKDLFLTSMQPYL